MRLCGSRDGQHCDRQWIQGQIIQELNTKKLCRYYAKYFSGYRLIWWSSLNTYLDFTVSSFIRGQQGTFYFCPP